LGSAFIKAACQHVGEIVPWWNIDYNEMPVTNMWNETNYIRKNQQQQQQQNIKEKNAKQRFAF